MTQNVKKREFALDGIREGCYNLAKINKDLVIKIGSETVRRPGFIHQNLGVIIDDKLKWENQIDSLSKKVPRGIGAVKLIKLDLCP